MRTVLAGLALSVTGCTVAVTAGYNHQVGGVPAVAEVGLVSRPGEEPRVVVTYRVEDGHGLGKQVHRNPAGR